MLATVISADEIDLDGSGEIFDDELEDSDCIEQWGDVSMHYYLQLFL